MVYPPPCSFPVASEANLTHKEIVEGMRALRKSEYADRVLVSLECKTILAPPTWGLEISNAILVGERKQRLNQSDMGQFAKLLEGLSLVQDMQAVGRSMETVLLWARHHGLSAYDAAYLNLRSGRAHHSQR